MQRNDEERKCQKRAALVFIHGHSQIAKTSAEEGVREIEPAHWVDVTARGVNGGLVRRKRAKQIIKAGRQIAQAGAQMQVTSAKRLSLYGSGSRFRSTVWISVPGTESNLSV